MPVGDMGAEAAEELDDAMANDNSCLIRDKDQIQSGIQKTWYCLTACREYATIDAPRRGIPSQVRDRLR